MVFSSEDKAIIKNDFVEKGWSSDRICQEHPSKNWNIVSVHRLLKRFEKDGSMDRQPGSGRLVTVTTEENEELVEIRFVRKRTTLVPTCHHEKLKKSLT